MSNTIFHRYTRRFALTCMPRRKVGLSSAIRAGSLESGRSSGAETAEKSSLARMMRCAATASSVPQLSRDLSLPFVIRLPRILPSHRR